MSGSWNQFTLIGVHLNPAPPELNQAVMHIQCGARGYVKVACKKREKQLKSIPETFRKPLWSKPEETQAKQGVDSSREEKKGEK